VEEFRPYLRRPSYDDRVKAWTEGLVLLDASALLGQYRFPPQTTQDLLSIYAQFGDRLWVPHQAMLEFSRNRESVLADQDGAFRAAGDALESGMQALRSAVAKMASAHKIGERHRLLDSAELLSPFELALEQAESLLGEKRSQQKGHTEADPTMSEIESLVGSRITPTPTQVELDAVFAEGASRFEKQQPPGYEDVKGKRGKRYTHLGLAYEAEYGDLLLWKQMVELAQGKGAKCMIFVTDDQKDDWWYRRKGKAVAPRLELVQEAHGYGIETLLFYTPADLLREFTALRDELGAPFRVRAGSAEGATAVPPTMLSGSDVWPQETVMRWREANAEGWLVPQSANVRMHKSPSRLVGVRRADAPESAALVRRHIELMERFTEERAENDMLYGSLDEVREAFTGFYHSLPEADQDVLDQFDHHVFPARPYFVETPRDRRDGGAPEGRT
jgi:hypothetical protein